MAATRDILKSVTAHVAESTGASRQSPPPLHVPEAHPKDEGRRPVRDVGRIDIDRVVPDSDQPRKEFEDDSLEQLAESFRANGQLVPVCVRWSDVQQRWVIVFGERRWRAACRAGFTQITCVFIEGEMTQEEILEYQLIENCLRQDLQPIEEARAFSRLMDQKGLNGKQLAETLNIPASRVSRTLALLDLPEPVQRQVAAGDIPARTAYELSRLGSESEILLLAQQAANGKLTVAESARVATRQAGNRPRRAASIRQSFTTEAGWNITATAKGSVSYHDLEEALNEALEEVRHRIANGLRLF